jgi:hypothetical protein
LALQQITLQNGKIPQFLIVAANKCGKIRNTFFESTKLKSREFGMVIHRSSEKSTFLPMTNKGIVENRTNCFMKNIKKICKPNKTGCKELL